MPSSPGDDLCAPLFLPQSKLEKLTDEKARAAAAAAAGSKSASKQVKNMPHLSRIPFFYVLLKF